MKTNFYLGIGAPRSGTTWLYNNLRNTSDLYLPPVKELRYFKGVRSAEEKQSQAQKLLADANLSPEDRSFVQHWQNTQDGQDDAYLSLFPDKPKIGEVSPIYSILPPKRVKQIHDIVADLNPRVFYLLRNPFFRDISHVVFTLHRQRNVKTVHPVETYMEFVDRPLFQRRSDYSRNVKAWRGVFGDNLKLYFFDDMEKDPEGFFDKFCQEMDVSYSLEFFKEGRDNASGRDGRFLLEIPDPVLQHLRTRSEKLIAASRIVPSSYKQKWMDEISAYFSA
ncbi:MAG: sulfotransferase [Hyphomicrobiaceae bacterium]|nr:sulfotransferase [Hyphomicrobiaceae bacterium]